MAEAPETFFIYVIGSKAAITSEQGPVKVGISRDLASRLKQLQTGSPEALYVLHALATSDRLSAREIEASFHRVYRERRTSGEWFAIAPRMAIYGVCLSYINFIAACSTIEAEELVEFKDISRLGDGLRLCGIADPDDRIRKLHSLYRLESRPDGAVH